MSLKNEPVALSDVLKIVIQNNDFEKDIIASKLPEYWLEIVGENIAKYAKIDSVKNGVALIIVETSSWKSELILRRFDLIDKLNQKIGKQFIKKLYIFEK